MTDKTIRELTEDSAPVDSRLIETQAATGSSEPTKSTLAQFRARMQVGLAAVAASGNYSDLAGLPTLGALAALATVGTAQIDNSAVTLAKIVNASAQYKLLGRSSAAAGVWQELSGSANVFAILTAADYAAIRTLLSLDTMALQAAAAVAITGGSIVGTAHRFVDSAKTASFSFAVPDCAVVIQASHATVPIVGTIPTDVTIGGAGWPIGSILYLEQHDDAAVSFAAAVGVTINKPLDRTLFCRRKHSPIAARRTGVNEWVAFGALGT